MTGTSGKNPQHSYGNTTGGGSKLNAIKSLFSILVLLVQQERKAFVSLCRGRGATRKGSWVR